MVVGGDGCSVVAVAKSGSVAVSVDIVCVAAVGESVGSAAVGVIVGGDTVGEIVGNILEMWDSNPRPARPRMHII